MIVVGLGFGDEGKGLTTSFLCSQVKNPLVVRFNGGHQAGHTVVYNGERHVFSSFGSGTLQGAPTYWSAYCTFYPTAFLNEWNIFKKSPLVFINPLCPVTTPYDVEYNKYREKMNGHGSVGVGFGTTIDRHQKNYKLYVQDLFHEKILFEKLKMIQKYYKDAFGITGVDTLGFLDDIAQAKNLIWLATDAILSQFDPIFEGAQGILLDQDFGFFPNVTRSNTTSKNAVKMYSPAEDIYYVTRCYQTRHGNGFMTNEHKTIKLINNDDETNIYNIYQRHFRVAPIDTDLINYSIECDSNFSKDLEKNLIITCVDQLPDFDVDDMIKSIEQPFSKIYISKGPSLENISLYKSK